MNRKRVDQNLKNGLDSLRQSPNPSTNVLQAGSDKISRLLPQARYPFDREPANTPQPPMERQPQNRANMRNQKEANGPGLILPTDFADETSLFSWQSRRIFSLTLESVASCFSYDSNDSRAAIGNHGDGIERGKTDVGRGVESIAPTAPRSGIFPLAVR